jgi:hypothetical protein
MVKKKKDCVRFRIGLLLANRVLYVGASVFVLFLCVMFPVWFPPRLRGNGQNIFDVGEHFLCTQKGFAVCNGGLNRPDMY